MFHCDQCGKAFKTSRGLEQHRIKFHEAPRVENVTMHECGYCPFKSKWKHSRDRHEEEYCKEKEKQMKGPDNALSKDEAVQWFSESNCTKTTFNSILENISLKWGSNFLQKGVKVRKSHFGFIL